MNYVAIRHNPSEENSVGICYAFISYPNLNGYALRFEGQHESVLFMSYIQTLTASLLIFFYQALNNLFHLGHVLDVDAALFRLVLRHEQELADSR